ncbi:sensor histidine kinase [Nonomuraea rubra]|uniref:sensor histidine kinase n=1 Tax=Nonomuraea rubra TaxID=46180 RepID=UPI003617952F
MTVPKLGELDFSRGRTAARVGSCVWLLLVGWPLWSFLESGPGPLAAVAALGLVAVFALCWLMVMWRMLSRLAGTPRPWALAGATGAWLALLPLFGAPWAYTSFVFMISAFAASMPVPAFAAAAVATAAVEVLTLVAAGVPPSRFWWVPPAIGVQSVVVAATKSMGLLVSKLDAARVEMAQLAVENERLRFARDLHDTLGHTLTSITIRSQLAARLAPGEPDRAAREMAEVEGPRGGRWTRCGTPSPGIARRRCRRSWRAPPATWGWRGSRWRSPPPTGPSRPPPRRSSPGPYGRPPRTCCATAAPAAAGSACW